MSPISRAIYVISDLHLGGECEPGKRGLRLCTHEPELANFIGFLAGLRQPGIELVINGDFVDFLAEPVGDHPPRWSAFHFPEEQAIAHLDRIAARSGSVFTALKAFLRQGHRLVILPGNHDIELNLPAVRRRLRHHIGADQPADYEFIAHGEAYRVGDVLIEHGNRVDEMNFVDYQVLRRLCGLVSRGMAVHDDFLFDPPAGSKLVANVINEIKARYSFIDLLKPEAEAAFPVILALEPGRRRQLLSIASALRKGKNRRKEQLMHSNSNISAIGAVHDSTDESQPSLDALEEILVRTVGRTDFALPSKKPDGVGAVDQISLLDNARSFASLLRSDSKSWDRRIYDLLDALRAFECPGSFDRSVETATAYINEACNLAYGPVRHVVFGHTHLPKQVPLPGGGFYFNSGTWADLLELPRNILDPTRELAPLAELEQLIHDLIGNDFSPYTLFHPTYVHIEQDAGGNSVVQQLCDYSWEQPK